MESTNPDPPSYEEVTVGRERPRIIAHNFHCTEQSNEQYIQANPHLQVHYLPIRSWVHQHAKSGTTSAESPWWLADAPSQRQGITWDIVQTVPSTPPADQETTVQWLRRLCTQSAAPHMLALGGTPLKPGDTEYTIDTRHNWTHDWGWEIELYAYEFPQHIRCAGWSVTMRIHLHDLPRQLQAGGIRWKNLSTSDFRYNSECDSYPHRSWDWKLSTICSPRGDAGEKTWEAWVRSARRRPPLTSEFWTFLSADTVYSAKIKQRTDRDKYKVVMWYSHSTAYANDLTGQGVEDWRDGFSERFAEFIRPLVPRGSILHG